MTRQSYRPLAVLLLLGSVISYVGCSSGTDEKPKSDRGPAPTPAVPSLATNDGSGPKLFADWPTPVGALLITGEQDGYLEPCGCTSGQLGGLRRRYDLIEWIREQGWPLTLMDLGSLIKDPAAARGGFEQSKAKFDIALKALRLLKYDALALSAEDLKVGVDEALMQYMNNLAEQPKVVVANVTAAPGFEKTIRNSIRTSAGAMKIGITAVIDPGALQNLSDPAKGDLLPSIVPPEQALGPVLADLEKDTQIQVLLVQGPSELAHQLAQKFPGFDVVVETSQFDPAEDAERLNDGKTMLVSVGKKGKYVGVVGVFNDPKQKLRYQRVTLTSRYNGAAVPMRKLIEDDFQKMLEDKRVVEDFPRHNVVDAPEGATFVGAATCKSCHPNTYAKWSTTKHSHAFADIVTDPKGERSDHQFDAECISCHTTGFEYTSGWVSAEKTPYLKGNQCENCHGPASKHAADPDNAVFRKAIARTSVEADRNRLCIRCHDEDNSTKFDFQTYWGQIVHKGMDDYKDPKVHQGTGTVAAAAAASEKKP